jgi:hypothetical protein
MKKIFFSSICLLIIELNCIAQTVESKTTYPDRYRLYLPNGWNTSKVIKALSYVLPETILELKEKDFCTDCKAGFFVKLIVDSFSWDDQTKPGSYYHFKAILRVYDSTGNPVSQLVLISPEETFLIASQKKPTKLSNAPIMEDMNIYDDSGTKIIGSMPVVSIHSQETNYISSAPAKYSYYLSNDLLEYSKQALFKIKKMLKKLSESGQL